ncbi:MAG TPA: sulfite exporter TauE/SafE family protein [Burkholderiales bacterium]|nr:sulfite exporter TauE/SafE family protein [Burkholderiales bacterium]
MTETALASAFLIGLLGGVHCLGMCGGIVGALSLQKPGVRPAAGFQLAYNLGRILSYGAAGALAGALGAAGLLLAGAVPARVGLYVLANLMLIALGLCLMGAWQGVAVLERAGGALWALVRPVALRFIPVDSWPRALASGLLWGWLPCGMVYSVLTTAMFAGSAGRGFLVMLAFGLGTLPNLLTMGMAAERVRPVLQRRGVRMAAGWVVAAFGLIGLVRMMTHPLGPADFCAVP